MKTFRLAKLRSTSAIIAAVCIISVVIGAVSAGTRTQSTQDFAAFWQVFRKAVLEKNWQALTQMCNFPVTVKGVLDRDPVHRLGEREFPKFFEQFLREGVFSRNEELDFIRKTTALADDGRPARRVDDMIFRKTRKGWSLDTFYMQYTLD